MGLRPKSPKPDQNEESSHQLPEPLWARRRVDSVPETDKVFARALMADFLQFPTFVVDRLLQM